MSISYRNGRTGVVEARYFSVFFNSENRLERALAGDVEPADLE
jgi:hypothetical protein